MEVLKRHLGRVESAEAISPIPSRMTADGRGQGDDGSKKRENDDQELIGHSLRGMHFLPFRQFRDPSEFGTGLPRLANFAM